MELDGILDIAYNLGDYAIFIWLYLSERKSHNETISKFEQYLMDN